MNIFARFPPFCNPKKNLDDAAEWPIRPRGLKEKQQPGRLPDQVAPVGRAFQLQALRPHSQGLPMFFKQ